MWVMGLIYGSSRPELVAVGPIVAHVEDALVLVPSTACSGAYKEGY
jgi:hypothetical protein